MPLGAGVRAGVDRLYQIFTKGPSILKEEPGGTEPAQ